MALILATISGLDEYCLRETRIRDGRIHGAQSCNKIGNIRHELCQKPRVVEEGVDALDLRGSCENGGADTDGWVRDFEVRCDVRKKASTAASSSRTGGDAGGFARSMAGGSDGSAASKVGAPRWAHIIAITPFLLWTWCYFLCRTTVVGFFFHPSLPPYRRFDRGGWRQR